MGIIEKVIVSDETLRQLEAAARRHGWTVSEEVARRIEAMPEESLSREDLIARMRSMADSLPPQTTDSLTLLREDRAGNRY